MAASPEATICQKSVIIKGVFPALILPAKIFPEGRLFVCHQFDIYCPKIKPL
jgi:hypothetical protein